MGKVTTINLKEELYQHIKSKTDNISRFINNLIKEKMETEQEKIEKLKEEITIKTKEIEKLEVKKIEEQKIKEDLIKNLTKEQVNELKKSIEILNKEGGQGYFEGRYNRYKNLFRNIGKEEFKELLELFNNNKQSIA